VLQIFLSGSIISFGILITLAGIIYFRQPKERVNRSFAMMCLLMAVTAFTEATMRSSSGPAEARVWLAIGVASWHWAVTLMLFFCLYYTGKEGILRKRVLTAALLLVPTALSILELATPLLGVLPAAGVNGFERRMTAAAPLLPFAAGWEIAISLAAVFLLLQHHLTARERMARRQASWILSGFLMPLVAGVLTQGVLPQMGIRIPAVTAVSGAWLALFVGVSMWRYELFRLDPAQAADPMLSVMKEAVLLLDAGGIVAYANRCARRLWERPRQNLIGSPVAEVCGPGFLAAGGMERLLGDDRDSAVEISCTASDGTAVSLLASATFLRDGLGDVKGAVLVATDISGLKRLENTLQESRRMLRNLVDNGQAGILLLDTKGVIREANEPFARRFGFTASGVVGQCIFSLFPEALARERGRKFAEAAAAGIPMRFQDLQADRHWEHRLTPIVDGTGRVTGMTVFSLDVTDRVEAERARERLIGELRDALAKVKTLSGLIPICAHCKRIRNDKGYWQQVEQYVVEHTDADFSHGLCNDCLRTLYPELADEVVGDRPTPTRSPG